MHAHPVLGIHLKRGWQEQAVSVLLLFAFIDKSQLTHLTNPLTSVKITWEELQKQEPIFEFQTIVGIMQVHADGVKIFRPFALIAGPHGTHFDPKYTALSPQSHCDVILFQTKTVGLVHLHEKVSSLLLALITLLQVTQIYEDPLIIIAEDLPQSHIPFTEFQVKVEEMH